MHNKTVQITTRVLTLQCCVAGYVTTFIMLLDGTVLLTFILFHLTVLLFHLNYSQIDDHTWVINHKPSIFVWIGLNLMFTYDE